MVTPRLPSGNDVSYRALYREQSLDTGFLIREIQETVPLSTTRREDFERLRATARDRFVSAE